MKRYKLILTEKQVKTLQMVFQEADDGNSGEGKIYARYRKAIGKLDFQIYKQLEKQKKEK